MMLLVFLTQPGGPLSKWTNWVEWLSSTSLFSRVDAINTRPILLRMRAILKRMLEAPTKHHLVYYSPSDSEKGGVDREVIPKEGPSKWQKRTCAHDETGLEYITSGVPAIHQVVTDLVWSLNEEATDKYRAARTLYWSLYSLLRLHTAGSKISKPVIVETAVTALIEADSRAGAIPDVAPGSLFIRKETGGQKITVGRWLSRFLAFRAEAQKASVAVSKDLTVGAKSKLIMPQDGLY